MLKLRLVITALVVVAVSGCGHGPTLVAKPLDMNALPTYPSATVGYTGTGTDGQYYCSQDDAFFSSENEYRSDISGTVTQYTPDSLNQVFVWFTQTLARSGWREVAKPASGSVLEFAKAGNELFVWAGPVQDAHAIPPPGTVSEIDLFERTPLCGSP